MDEARLQIGQDLDVLSQATCSPGRLRGRAGQRPPRSSPVRVDRGLRSSADGEKTKRSPSYRRFRRSCSLSVESTYTAAIWSPFPRAKHWRQNSRQAYVNSLRAALPGLGAPCRKSGQVSPLSTRATRSCRSSVSAAARIVSNGEPRALGDREQVVCPVREVQQPEVRELRVRPVRDALVEAAPAELRLAVRREVAVASRSSRPGR